MGKAIYNPSGKAGEYSYWAANFYNGCSADCEYCYCKNYPMSQFWSTTPTLKKSLGDVEKAKKIFVTEVHNNIDSLREHGLFFNFSSDPFLKETIKLNLWAIWYCYHHSISAKILTKQTWWLGKFSIPKNICLGFTLTGHDELESGAASNSERIETMKSCYKSGVKTWASIEPIIDFESSWGMINQTRDFCHLYKIGLKSGKKYDIKDLKGFVYNVVNLRGNFKIYWKDELLKQGNLSRDLPRSVERDYKI